MEYKNTLLILKTDFEMKANLKEKESKFQQKWSEDDIYNKALLMNKENKQFILHDGPPYANGNLHVGHALNKILKDIIVRFNTSQGYYTPFICGWDTHGLPIESAITKTGVDRKNLKAIEFRKLCKNYALEQTNNQQHQFSKFALFTDFNKKYVTLDLNYQLTQLELFKTMVEKQLAFRHLKPIYWSPSSETALAEAEVEYRELRSASIYVTFKVIDGKGKLAKGDNVVIWTTTPWTIPANQLLAVGNDIEYVLVSVNNQNYLVASELLPKLKDLLQWENVEIVNKFMGQDLAQIITTHPFYNRESKIVIGHHVTTESGTGIVHVATGFGIDDYLIGQENNIEVFAPVDNQGKFTVQVEDEDLNGVFYEDANKIVTSKLQQNNNLLHLSFFKHSYPVDWRTKLPIIYRATAQWFVSIDKIKAQIIEQINNVKWNPFWAKERMSKMIENRNDWCISRQRLWGVPIIAFYDENENVQLSVELIDYVLAIFKTQGIDCWFEKPTDFFLPEKYRNLNWKKEQDIMDVWFDSGSSHLGVIKNENLSYPIDVYLEGTDQFRGWFNSSLITGVIANGIAPYKEVISHGFVNDEKGRKMSKSQGNVVDPLKIVDQYGADILRLWVASTSYSEDVKVGEDILKQVAESYRKIRNTMRFLLANLSDFDFAEIDSSKLSEVDLFMIAKTKNFKKKIKTAYQNYDFNRVYNLTLNFVINDLSSFYLDFIKDILYIEKVDGVRRRSVQLTLSYILQALIDALRSILIHTVEEAYTYFNIPNKAQSVHLQLWSDIDMVIDQALIDKWNKVLLLREDVNKSLEIARENKSIKKSLETKITLYLKPNFQELKNIVDLHQILITSEVEVLENNDQSLIEFTTAYIKVNAKIGEKCKRCWMIFDQLKNGEICTRCYNVISELSAI